ncbi:MAG: heme o synthase [Pseudomonadota bacterium]
MTIAADRGVTVAPMVEETVSDRGARAARWQDYAALLKPRVMSLVVFTGLAGLIAAPGDLHPALAVIAIIAIALGAGAAGAINCWYEADVDAIMRRTKARPVPMGIISREDAISFALMLSGAMVLTLGLFVNWVAGGLLAFTIFYYGVVYTMWLKRRTAQNIVIGGASGAFPPVIGWAAVTGDVTLLPIILFTIIFLWTPPHFWALSLYAAGDYEKAGIPMLPVTAGAEKTRRHSLIYTLVLFPVALAPWALGYAGWVYGLGATLLGLLFIAGAVDLVRQRTDEAARRVFGYSIFYLFGIFGLLIIEQLGSLLL